MTDRSPDAKRTAVPNLSRRHVLQTGARVAGTGMFGWLLATAPSGWSPAKADEQGVPAGNLKDGYIDAHVHVWTPDTTRYRLSESYKKEDMQPASFTPEELFSHAGPTGVTRVVLIQMSFYGFDNSYMLDVMHEHQGVFSGVAVIDDSAEKPEEEMRRLAKLGVRGFRLFPQKRPIDKWFASPGIAAMWKAGAEDGLAMCCLINPEMIPAVDKMCEKFADTPVVIDHFARIGVDGKIRDEDVKQLCRLARHKHTSVKVSAFYALGKKKPPYTDLIPMARKLLDAYGPERLMWASDCPFQVDPGHNYKDSIDLVRERMDFLTDGDREWLLKKTAERVFFS